MGISWSNNESDESEKQTYCDSPSFQAKALHSAQTWISIDISINFFIKTEPPYEDIWMWFIEDSGEVYRFTPPPYFPDII